MVKKERAKYKRMNAEQIVSDFLDGMTHADIARKYKLNRPSVTNLLAREIGFLQMAYVRGREPRKSIKARYIDNWMTIAQGIVDRIGYKELADKLNISWDMVAFVRRDLMSDSAYFRLTHPETGCNTVEERNTAVINEVKRGVAIRRIMRKYHISQATINKILNETSNTNWRGYK